MFICLLKAHPWVLTPPPPPLNGTFLLAGGGVCVEESERGEEECREERWWWWWGASSLHQMKPSAGTLLSQTGTHLPMVSCKVLGEAGTKVLKGCVTMRGAFKSGTQAARDGLCQSLRNYFFVEKAEALCGHSAGGARTRAAAESCLSPCFLPECVCVSVRVRVRVRRLMWS